MHVRFINFKNLLQQNQFTNSPTHITHLQDKEKLELVLTKKHNLPFSTINFFKQMMCLYKS